MTTVREQAIEAGARALAVERSGPHRSGKVPDINDDKADVAAVVDAVTPILLARVRDEERASYEAYRDQVEADERERLRAQVEALPQAAFALNLDDPSPLIWRADVLDLLDGAK